MLIHCSFCNSDSVMPKSGLCLSCGKIKEFSGKNSLQTDKLLSEKDNEIVFEQEAIEQQNEASVIEMLVNQSVVYDAPTAELLFENSDNKPDSANDRQPLDFDAPIDAPINEYASVTDNTWMEEQIKNIVSLSDFIVEQQEKFIAEAPENVSDTSKNSVEPQQLLDIATPDNEAIVSESVIGIRGLESCYGSIEKHGLFVVTVPSFSFAKSISVQTIIHNPYIKTTLISFGESNDWLNITPEINKKLFEIYEIGNLLLSFVNIKENENLFSKIKQDMEKKEFASVGLVLIDIDQDIFISTTDDELVVILSSWQSWFIRHKKTCVWIVHGDIASGFLRDKFLKLNNMFNGLASIKTSVSETTYEVVFWHLYSSVQSNFLLHLVFDELNHEISVVENNKLAQKNTKIILPLTDFVRQVISLVDCGQRMHINSLLVKLSLNRAIPIEGMSALIQTKHSTDIFTFTEKYLYFFLFQCEEHEMKTAISNLILLPIEYLFLEQEYFSRIDEIRSEINNIVTNNKIQKEQWQSVMNTSESDDEIVRKPAISLPLL